MLKTKKDVDQHVRKSFTKCKTDNERNYRGFAVAKLYYRINEFTTAQQYISGYLTVQEDNSAAHKLLGQCYQRLKKPDKALESYQRSLQLDSKQPDLLIEVCKLLLTDDNLNMNKAQYWCDLAESEKVNDDAVFNLRLKLLNKDNSGLKQMEEAIRTEIVNRPTDSKLRIRLIQYFVDKDKICDAFKYAIDLEYSSHDVFSNSSEWYNTVSLILRKYQQLPNVKRDWNYWLLLITCLERQIFLSFDTSNNSTLPNVAFTETANLLFNFDNNLQEAAQVIHNVCEEKELAKQFLKHFRGQLCLHAASLLFKREIVQNKNQWRETTKIALPLLLLAYQCGSPDLQEAWLKHCGDKAKSLIQLWNKEAAFRCVQSGRCILSCIDDEIDNKSIVKQVNQYINDRSPWNSVEALLFEIRQYCSDTSWRTKIFRLLFSNSDQTVKISSSHLVQNENLREPIYEIPSYADIESYEEIAQYLRPQSLHHMTYICLGKESLHQTRCTYFNGLNFSTKNLSFCGAESLNQLDIETFLYATIIQTKRTLEIERNCYESYNSKSCGRPGILPYVNIFENLCTEEQDSWWTSAYQAYKNLSVENLGEIRANLQHGIESVRGINGPKIDLIIVLKLGKIFIARANEAVKPIEKTYLEQRSNNLFKLGLNMLKLQNKGVLEPFRRFFKYSQGNSSKIEREINKLAEESITYLATSYFRNSEYEEAIEEFQGIELPYAAYFQAEAYRKLDESNKTPKKTKKIYEDKARDCLNHTLTLLGNNSENNHPLNNIIQSQIKRSQFTNQISGSLNDRGLNGDANMFPDFHFSDGEYSNETAPIMLQLNRSVRSNTPQQIHVSTSSNADLENLVKQMASTLTFLKEEFVDSIKPEITGIKKDLQEMKEKIIKIEEQVQKIKHKSSETPSRADDTSNVLDDLYIIDDEIQNQIYQSQQQQPQPNMYSTGSFAGQQRMHTPNINQQHLLNNPYINSPLYNSNYGAGHINYFPPYMMPTQQQINQAAASVVAAQRNALGLGGYHLSYTDPLNINLPQPQLPTANQPNIPLNIDSRTNTTPTNLYNLLQQNQPDNRMGHQILPSQSANLVQPSQPTNTTIWNKTSINNQPVEKGPPHNVVITNSDPLPLQNVSTSQTLPTLSVTIPTHHIKSSLLPSNEPQLPTTNAPATFSMFSRQNQPLSTPLITAETTPTIAPFSFNFPKTTIASNTSLFTTSTPSSMNFSNVSPSLNPATESTEENELYKSVDGEYDPRPDFKPIIPLPAEIEVRTGEENEEVLFCHRAKLYRLVEKDWKERGIGDIKILKNKSNNKYRILMRRDQIHKICANHQITSDLQMQQGKNDEKCYIWVANDFADEELKLEKFCIRFKYPEKAKEFYELFNKCRNLENLQKDEIEASTNKTVNNQNILTTSKVATMTAATTTTSPFTFTFSNSAPKTETNSTSTKPSPFANFAFTKESTPKIPTETIKPFENIFQSLNKSSTLSNNSSLFMTPKSDVEITSNEQNKVLNKSASDNEDYFEPNVQFEPVISLPAEIEITTGEENENVLFEHRAKLFRFDKPTSEWKERGLGNMKILQDKEDKNKIRILMRRDTIHKLCCNQRLLKDTKFKHPPNSQNSLQWVGKDFSENELTTETFTIRFKTADICKNFYDTILRVQNEMTDESNSKIVENKKQEVKGFGDQFKPKTGSWSCKDCYVQNVADANYCVSCQAPKNDAIPKKDAQNIGVDLSTKSKFSFGFGNNDSLNESKKSENKGFGDAFKPKTGSWDCKGCYLNNTGDQNYCVACAAPKDDTIPKKEPINFFSNISSTPTKFSFGFVNAESNTTNQIQGFGDQFKPKTGSWRCKSCLVCNTVDDVICVACKAEKNVSDPSDSNPLNQNKAGISFNCTTNSNFTVPTVTNNKTNSAFNFGSSFGFGTKTDFSTNPVEVPKTAFSFNNGEDGADFRLGKKEFNFQLKAKSPGKVKSPLKNSISGTDDNYESDEECVEEENNTYFTPVIPLPEKVDVVTGEENEDVLYCHRAKLYRYADKEWKERGLGDIKILRHRSTKNLRVVMRREQVLKICLNHVLNSDVEYKSKDEKSWSFAVNDFTEGELKFEQFSLRFKNKEIAKDFMSNVINALGQSNSVDTHEINDKLMNEKNRNDSCISEENKSIADKLMLPYSFFMEPASVCLGCRGCDPDNFKFSSITKNPEVIEDDKDALPLEHQSNNLRTSFDIANNSNSFSTNQSTEAETRTNLFSSNVSVKNDDNSNIFANIPKPVSNFSFMSQVNNENKTTGENKPTSGFLFSNNSQDSLFKNNLNKDATSIFGGQSIFGNSTSNVEKSKTNENKANEQKQSDFSENVLNTNGGIFVGPTIFGPGNKTTALNATPLFGGAIFGSIKSEDSTSNKNQPEQNTTTSAKLEDNNDIYKSSGFVDFSSLVKSADEKPAFFKPSDNSSTNFIGLKNESAKNMSTYGKLDDNNGIFKATGFVDFSSLAKSTDEKPAFLTNNDSGSTNFIGLTHQNAFSSFDKANKLLNTSNPNESGTGGEEDGNYDPHYEPIIELPKEIVVSTGEENEEKIYGERVKLFRYDSDLKEWKERGVGELKILYHPINRAYRLILRREQIHKLVLNHAIGVDFQMAPMSNSPKAFIWGAVNYAEEPSQTERLAVRFKNSDLATKFETKINMCLEELKKTHADLEPEED